MLGNDYLIDHCLASIKRKSRRDAYEIYTTDIYRALTIQLGATSVRRFADIVNPKPVDNRSAEEIVADITERAGLVVKK